MKDEINPLLAIFFPQLLEDNLLRRDPNADHMLTPEQIEEQKKCEELLRADCSPTVH